MDVEERPKHRRGFTLDAYKTSYDGSLLSHWDGAIYFDDNYGYDLPGVEHAEVVGCSHCEIRQDNEAYLQRSLRAGAAFARFLEVNAPPSFIQGMMLCWSGLDPFITEN